jgi:hypothetical protein
MAPCRLVVPASLFPGEGVDLLQYPTYGDTDDSVSIQMNGPLRHGEETLLRIFLVAGGRVSKAALYHSFPEVCKLAIQTILVKKINIIF